MVIVKAFGSISIHELAKRIEFDTINNHYPSLTVIKFV